MGWAVQHLQELQFGITAVMLSSLRFGFPLEQLWGWNHPGTSSSWELTMGNENWAFYSFFILKLFATEAKCTAFEISENLEAAVFHQLLPHLFWEEKCLQMLSKRRTSMGRIHGVCENPPAVLRCALRAGCLGDPSWPYRALTLIIGFSLD